MSTLQLDVFGQQPGLSNLYTQITSCFPLTDASYRSAIVDVLTRGLERLSASFPWIAGQVVKDETTGIYKIEPLETIPRFVVKDLCNNPSMPTMETLRCANFPFSMLDENIIAPRNTLPGTSTDNVSPVFLVQATFVTGGLLLTFVAQHNVMDMKGQGWMIDLFAKACRHEQFTSEEILYGNPDRRSIIPLLSDSYEPGRELKRQIANPDAVPSPPSQSSWAYFIFNPTSLALLKSFASKTITLDAGYISTDDALSAFIWKSITRARLPRLDHTAEVTLARAVDARRYLGIPATYPGMVQNMTYTTYTAGKLVEEQLGAIASQLRLAVDPKRSDLGFRTRALATLLDRSSAKNNVSVTATLNLSSDIMLSSWAKEDFYTLDFNLGLGKPEAVRRPGFTPVESLLYLMPKGLDGEIAAAICLSDEDMDRLKVDNEFAQFGRYIG